MTQVPFYDALASDYDRFVNWEGRLAHELPFLERLFASHDVRRVLDAACGTGHHAIALARRGYEAVGADLSAAMIEQARRNAAAAGAQVGFSVAGFGGLAALGETFDAVLCLGNSLPHLLTEKAQAEALSDFATVLHPGGVVVIQNRNFDRVWRLRERFMGPQSCRDGEREWVFVRFYDFHEATVSFNMIRLQRDGDVWTQDVESTELRPIFHDGLAGALGRAGFFRAAFHGGYDRSPFDPAHSSDLIAVAQK